MTRTRCIFLFAMATGVLPLAATHAAEPPPAEAVAPVEPTVEDLLKQISSKDDVVLYETLQALAAKGPQAAPAVADLIKILKDEKRALHIRVESALVLGEIGPAAKDAVPSLIEILKAKDATLRAYSAKALGGIGPDASVAVKPLAVALRDPNPGVRRMAAKAIGAIRVEDAEAKAALEFALANDGDKGVEENCKAALRNLDEGKKAKSAAAPPAGE